MTEWMSPIIKILASQLGIAVVMSAFFALFSGQQAALSAFLGGVVAFIPNLYFAAHIYRSSDKDARSVLNAFYRAESRKLLLTAALFAMVFQVPNIEFLPLLAVFIAALSVFWFALLFR